MTNAEFVNAYFENPLLNRHSGNLLTAGGILFSYGQHFPMAIVDHEFNIVFLTSEKYSVTTERHKSLVRSEAYRWGYDIIEIPYIEDLGPQSSKTDLNFDHLDSEINNALAKQKRAVSERMQEFWALAARRLKVEKTLLTLYINN